MRDETRDKREMSVRLKGGTIRRESKCTLKFGQKWGKVGG